MADNDWDTVTRIGSKARGPGSGGIDRERVVKGKSAINAAQRSGAIVGTEKKYASANSKSAVEGQHLTKVDRSDDIVPVKTGSKQVGLLISQQRQKLNLNQQQLASASRVKVGDLRDIESGLKPATQNQLSDLEKVLKISLRGQTIGQPKGPGKKKDGENSK